MIHPVQRLTAPLTVEDGWTLAKLHRESIPDGFLTSLGLGVLRELYLGFASSAHATIHVSREEGRIVGFIACAEDTGAVYRDVLRRRGVNLAWRAAALLLSPKRLWRATETLFYPSRGGFEDLPRAEVLNFCVRSELRGGGHGRALFETAMRELADRGVRAVRIVTGASQDRAQRFYRAARCEEWGAAEVHVGSGSVVFIHRPLVVTNAE